MFDEIQGGEGTAPKQEEVEEWRTLISSLTSQLQEAKDQIAALEAKGQPGLTPEMEALRDQVASISGELQEAKNSLAEAREELSQMRQSARSVEGDNLTQETPKEGLSGQTDQSDQNQVRPTRAARLGWLR